MTEQSAWSARTASTARSLGSPDRLDINRETLRNWVNAERRKTEQPEVVDLEAENARLRKELDEANRASEILKSASGFFARELDRPQRR